jgi:hypothetical protein
MPHHARDRSAPRANHRQFDVEAKLLEEGREDIRSGRCISGDAADEWLNGLDGDQELPIPGAPGNRSAR